LRSRANRCAVRVACVTCLAGATPLIAQDQQSDQIIAGFRTRLPAFPPGLHRYGGQGVKKHPNGTIEIVYYIVFVRQQGPVFARSEPESEDVRADPRVAGPSAPQDDVSVRRPLPQSGCEGDADQHLACFAVRTWDERWRVAFGGTVTAGTLEQLERSYRRIYAALDSPLDAGALAAVRSSLLHFRSALVRMLQELHPTPGVDGATPTLPAVMEVAEYWVSLSEAVTSWVRDASRVASRER
jgi:hypothetical protein